MPTYNLKAVVQETGLKHDTLRAWERRYGLPQPQRTPGGHRLYSARDIATLKWLVARQQEGLSISRAVDLWNQLQSEGRDPLAEMDTVATVPGFSAALPAGGNAIDIIRQTWIDACLSFNESKAEQVLTQASALFAPEIVCAQILQKGVARIGELWAAGEASVQQEHLASTLASRRLEALIAATPGPTRPGKILVACPPHEQHVFGMLVITFVLRRNGWETLFLGANVPLADMEETVAAVNPNLVILAAQQIYTAVSLLETARLLNRLEILCAFGGQIFNRISELPSRIPGYFLGQDFEQLPQMVGRILAGQLPPPAAEPTARQFTAALEQFHDRQPRIESAVWDALHPDEFSQVVLAYWNLVLARNVAGALALGNPAFLDADPSWQIDMLLNHNLPESALRRYLHAYYQAAQLHLDNRGRPLLDWLARFAG